ncbi:beta and beta-prime subunits of DNA dependent RNA-polymerase [Anaeromyces robustus]|uniref:DNA-directed RNA polymerase n=1 Tax=Anaeromyces robustus TaxID=1754192 RepID=A0A1Y1WY32_9FUNG|nr:beta and beta-prime subunits of DNA dependent RNA-polymerase [Anaeromyces robustus]|eukprot:ORX78477.1 beta and beta-prime subunits of DNA dependent RNA-polymerase [Anaeromyces robustus]
MAKNISETDINYICNKILNQYKDENEQFISYVESALLKIRKYLEKKPKSENFKPDAFAEIIIKRINSRKVKSKTHVGIIAAQSIGEPVTQSALSYFHKLSGGDENINGLKELYKITHNKFDFSTVEFYLKPGDYDDTLRQKILNSMKYVNLNRVVLDVVYDGFNLRFYLYPHVIYSLKMHPSLILQRIKKYLKETNNNMATWDSTINLDLLYIEFIQPASKFLNWLDSKGIEYLVDSDILCIYKIKETSFEKDGKNTESNNDKDDTSKNTKSNNNKDDTSKNTKSNNNKDDTSKDIESNNDTNNEINTTEKNDNESKITNKFLFNYLISNNIEFDEKERYLILDSNYIYLNYENIKNLLDNVTLTGTKGVKKVSSKYRGDEFYIEVIGTDLDPLFENEYIDPDRSHYITYSNTKKVDNDLRKQSILKQLKRITNTDNSIHSTQHIDLLTDFMCRNDSITPMSRFGMRNNNYPFISQLSFEDPLNIIRTVLYGVEDNLSTVSAKLITGIYNDKI